MTGSGGAAEAVRAFAFAEPEPGRWGAAWLPPGVPGVGVVGVGDRSSPGALDLDGAGAEEAWRLKSDGGLELVLEGLGEPAPSDPDKLEDGFDQLCRVTGKAQDGGRMVECLGWRGIRPAAGDRAVGSFRLVSGWFGAQDGFVLLAWRPRKAKG